MLTDYPGRVEMMHGFYNSQSTFSETHHKAIIDFPRISKSYDRVIPLLFTFPASDYSAV